MTPARRTLILSGAALGLIGASTVIEADPVLLWNASPSVPVGFYAVTPIDTPHVGDLVAVRPPPPLGQWLFENGYLGRDTPLLKRVVALPGAEICRRGTTITIAGHAVAEARERDRLGRRLPVWQGCQLLREDQVFLLNPEEPASLDGRYFGPLGADTIIVRATPVWTREG